MGLGAGESEVIELAISLENVIVVIDEKKGRAAAVAAGLRVTGTVGVLLEARERGHIHSVGLLLQNMRDSGFRISNSIFAEATAGDP
jgi:predicted nucleic acid-binding protein